ncbi:hypothetical protein RyT2_15850 [Pseudolactococcus yaeyamensis]
MTRLSDKIKSKKIKSSQKTVGRHEALPGKAAKKSQFKRKYQHQKISGKDETGLEKIEQKQPSQPPKTHAAEAIKDREEAISQQPLSNQSEAVKPLNVGGKWRRRIRKSSNSSPKVKRKTTHRARYFGIFFVKLIVIIGLVVSIFVMLYPLVSDTLNSMLDQAVMKEYRKQTARNLTASEKAHEKRSQEEKKRAEELKDPLSQASLQNAKRKAYTSGTYAEHTIGVVYIPKIQVNLPIFDSTKEDFLTVGSALVAPSHYPSGGVNRHSVVSAHRGLPSATLFSNLDQLKKGDLFIFEVAGKYLAYKVSEIHVVEPQDMSKVAPVEGKDLASLLTCTPYMKNTHRLIVTGERTEFLPSTLNALKEVEDRQVKNRALMVLLVVGIVIGTIAFIYTVFIGMLIKTTFGRIVFRLSDGKTDSEKYFEGAAFGLYDRKGREAMLRNGEHLIVRADETGLVLFDELPGLTKFVVKQMQPQESVVLPDFRCHLTQLKRDEFDMKALVKKKNRNKIYLYKNANGIHHFWVNRL